MTKALVLVAHTFARFKDLPVPGFSVESLWNHSMDTARLARQVAFSETSSTELQDQSFTAGLLHDIGKLMLAMNLPEDYQQVLRLAQEDEVPPFDAEMLVFGSSHAEVAGHLLRIWGLPEPIVEAVALHHCPQLTTSSEFSPLTSTHVANVLAHETASSSDGIPSSAIDQDYLRRIGMEDRLEAWRGGQFGGHLACA
jgi:putative nucleotidyltransferase with HDIG domain